MFLPTEPIGSIPRSKELLAAITAHAAGRMSEEQFHAAEEAALRDTISHLEQTGSPVITDGEQSKSSFATYPLAKLDPSGGPLNSFIEVNNRVLNRFNGEDRSKIGVHTCPGGDKDSTHSADVDYALLLPDLFRLNAGRFYVQLASEPDRRSVLRLLRDHLPPGKMLFIGVTDPINAKVESVGEVRDRVAEAAEFIPINALGTTDDCGFSPLF